MTGIGDGWMTVFGDGYKGAADVLVIMMITLVVNYLGVSFGYPAFGALNIVKWANITVIMASFVFCFMVIFLYITESINAINMAWTVLITELFVLLIRIYLIFVKFKFKRLVSIK